MEKKRKHSTLGAFFVKKAKRTTELEENRTSELHVFLEFHRRIYNFIPEFKIHKYSCSCRCSVRVRPGTEGRQVQQCDG